MNGRHYMLKCWSARIACVYGFKNNKYGKETECRRCYRL